MSNTDYFNPYVYKIRVEDGEIISKTAEDGTPHFKAPVTKKGKKIYLVGKDGLLHYVGITTQSMNTRLRQGIKPDTSTGYHGYRWLQENGDHTLIIYCFEDDTDVETIEAEIVYHFREQTGQWPFYQTEIHFHESNPEQRDISKEILKGAMKRFRNEKR